MCGLGPHTGHDSYGWLTGCWGGLPGILPLSPSAHRPQPSLCSWRQHCPPQGPLLQPSLPTHPSPCWGLGWGSRKVSGGARRREPGSDPFTILPSTSFPALLNQFGGLTAGKFCNPEPFSLCHADLMPCTSSLAISPIALDLLHMCRQVST